MVQGSARLFRWCPLHASYVPMGPINAKRVRKKSLVSAVPIDSFDHGNALGNLDKITSKYQSRPTATEARAEAPPILFSNS